MPRSGEAARSKLLNAAELLFVRDGLGAPLDAIRLKAGQRNATAVQYHFKNRNGLIQAILERHLPAVSEHRAALVALFAREDPSNIRRLAEAIVLPITADIDSSRGKRAYVIIVTAVMSDPYRPQSEIVRSLRDRQLHSIVDELVVSERFSRAVASDRVFALGSMLVHLCADRARIIEVGEPTRRLVPYQRFVSNLVDICDGGLRASVKRTKKKR